MKIRGMNANLRSLWRQHVWRSSGSIVVWLVLFPVEPAKPTVSNLGFGTDWFYRTLIVTILPHLTATSCVSF